MTIAEFKALVDSSITNKTAASSIKKTAVGGRLKELADLLVELLAAKKETYMVVFKQGAPPAESTLTIPTISVPNGTSIVHESLLNAEILSVGDGNVGILPLDMSQTDFQTWEYLAEDPENPGKGKLTFNLPTPDWYWYVLLKK